MSSTVSKSTKTSKSSKSTKDYDYKDSKETPICCNETKVDAEENTNSATHTSSWFSKYSIEGNDSGETCHLKSGTNLHLKQKMVPQTDLQKKTKVCIVLFFLLVVCVIIGGISISLLKVHDDYTCILKTETDKTVKRSNVEDSYSLELQASNIRRSSKEKRWCFICLRPLDDLVDTTTKLACGHEFHKDCVIEWLRTQNNCPLCKESENIMLSTPAGADNLVY